MNTTEKVQQHLQASDLRRTREEAVAQAIGVSATTMRRHLRRDGTTYQALLNAEHRRRIVDLLERMRGCLGWEFGSFGGWHCEK